jgi:Cu/Ag efflux pump CusA
MFKLREFENETEKAIAAQQVVERLSELPSKISYIRKYKFGTDTRKLAWSYDVVLEMDFENPADLEAYTIHPDHQSFVTFNKDFSIDKVCIDYEI